MKNLTLVLLSLFFVQLSLFACEGDCISCHPGLIKDGKFDKEHKVLKTCVTCHTKEQMSKIDMGGGCGQDCWECHDVTKVSKSGVKEHKGLDRCIKCHLKIQKESLIFTTPSKDMAKPTTLDNLLFK